MLRQLLRERVPVRDLVTILEAVADAAAVSKDPDVMTETVRVALGRTIEVYYRTGNLVGRYESGRPGPGEPIRLLYDRQFPMLPAEKDERNHYLCITKMPEG